MKLIKKDSNSVEDRINLTSISTLREMKLLKELRHKNIIDLVEVLIDIERESVGLVMTYAKFTVMKLMSIHKKKRLRMKLYTVKSLLHQILQGLKYLHSLYIMHRDIKPENILITQDGVVKLADFGLARYFRKPIKALAKVDKIVVTLWYRAPELLFQSMHYTPAIDIWSLGCIFIELCLCHALNLDQNYVSIFPGEPINEPLDEQGAGVRPVSANENDFEIHQLEVILKNLGTAQFTPKEFRDIQLYPRYAEFDRFLKKYPLNYFPRNEILSSKLFKEKLTNEGVVLVFSMLKADPNLRKTAKECLQSLFFTVENPLPGVNALA